MSSRRRSTTTWSFVPSESVRAAGTAGPGFAALADLGKEQGGVRGLTCSTPPVAPVLTGDHPARLVVKTASRRGPEQTAPPDEGRPAHDHTDEGPMRATPCDHAQTGQAYEGMGTT